jgi:hypothetical protein
MTHAFLGQKDLFLSSLSFAFYFPFPVRTVNQAKENIQNVANKWKELQPRGSHFNEKRVEAHSIRPRRRWDARASSRGQAQGGAFLLSPAQQTQYKLKGSKGREETKLVQ